MNLFERLRHWFNGTRCDHLINVREDRTSEFGPILIFGSCDVVNLPRPSRSRYLINNPRECDTGGVLGNNMAWCDCFKPVTDPATKSR